MAAPVVLLLVKVSLVLAAALAAAWMARRTAAVTRHRLWSSAFAAVLALPLLAVAVPGLPVPVPSWMATAVDAAWPIPTDIVRADREPRMAETIDATAQTGDGGLASSGLDGRGARGPRPSLPTVLAALWVAGALAALVSLAIALWRVRRLSRTACPLDDPDWAGPAAALAARLGVRGRVRLLVSPQVSTPMAGGILAPTIYLPATAAQWSAEQREVVLAHELSHLAGRDPLRQVLTRVALAAYWFHPLAWIAARQSAVAREQACDEAVLTLGTRPSLYARVLLDFADAPRGSMTGLAALPMVQHTHLEKRLMAILNENVRPSARRVALMPAAVAALTLSVAAAQPPAEIEPLAPAVAQTPSGVASDATGGVLSGATGGVSSGVAQGVASGAVGGVFTGVSGGVMSGAAERQAASVCYPDSFGSFSGSISMSDNDGSRTIHEAIGRRQDDVVIVKSFGDLRVCAMAEARSRDEALRPSQWAGAARRVIFETREGRETRRMEIEGSRVSWSVNGQSRAVDAAAGEWRNRLVALLDPLWQLSRLRGDVSSLRGQISSIHGERSSLRGQISSLRGQVSSMRGEISSWRGQESSLRGRISSIQGHLSSLRGRVSSERGAISSLEASRWRASDAEHARIAERIRAHEARIETIHAEIASYDADAKIREVEKALEQLAVHEKVADVEKRLRDFNLDQQVEAVETLIAQLDVEKRVAEIEQRIAALEADRRSRDLEGQIEAALTRLRALR